MGGDKNDVEILKNFLKTSKFSNEFLYIFWNFQNQVQIFQKLFNLQNSPKLQFKKNLKVENFFPCKLHRLIISCVNILLCSECIKKFSQATAFYGDWGGNIKTLKIAWEIAAFKVWEMLFNNNMKNVIKYKIKLKFNLIAISTKTCTNFRLDYF